MSNPAEWETVPISADTVVPLSVLDLFPIYNSVEDYKQATGKDAPALDTTKLLKQWFDPDALTAPVGPGKRADGSPNGITYGDGYGLYPILILGATDPKTGDVPVTASVVYVTRDEAATVNLPSSTHGYGGKGFHYQPVPQRPLDSAEAVIVEMGTIQGLFGGPALINKTLYKSPSANQPAGGGGGFSESDRTLLQAIAHKLGIGV